MGRWLSDRLAAQRRLTIGALVTTALIGVIATLMEFGLFYLIIRIGFVKHGAIAFLLTLMIQAVLQFVTVLRLPKNLPDLQHEAVVDAEPVIVSSAPNMTAVWTYSFGSIDSDRTWVERLLGLLSLPQRMCAAAWFIWQRLQQVKAMAVEPCARVIRLLAKEGERVSLDVIAGQIQAEDFESVIRDLSLIDGVVFLTRNDCGLSLANRLLEDLEAWKKRHRSS